MVGNGYDLSFQFNWILGKNSTNATLYETANQLETFTIGHMMHEKDLNSTFYETINNGKEL